MTLPVGVAAPAGGAPRVAVSWNDAPNVIVAGDTCVVTANVASPTVTDSPASPQAVVEPA